MCGPAQAVVCVLLPGVLDCERLQRACVCATFVFTALAYLFRSAIPAGCAKVKLASNDRTIVASADIASPEHISKAIELALPEIRAEKQNPSYIPGNSKDTTLAEKVSGLWYQESVLDEPVFVPVVDLLHSPHYKTLFEESASEETRLFATNPKEQLSSSKKKVESAWKKAKEQVMQRVALVFLVGTFSVTKLLSHYGAPTYLGLLTAAVAAIVLHLCGCGLNEAAVDLGGHATVPKALWACDLDERRTGKPGAISVLQGTTLASECNSHCRPVATEIISL